MPTSRVDRTSWVDRLDEPERSRWRDFYKIWYASEEGRAHLAIVERAEALFEAENPSSELPYEDQPVTVKRVWYQRAKDERATAA